jgi:hypothetical protein
VETGVTCNKAFQQEWCDDPNFQIVRRLTEEAMRDIQSIENETSSVLEVMRTGADGKT